VRTASAVINAFRPVITSAKPGDADMAKEMLDKSLLKTNHVFNRVEKGFCHVKPWWQLDTYGLKGCIARFSTHVRGLLAEINNEVYQQASK